MKGGLIFEEKDIKVYKMYDTPLVGEYYRIQDDDLTIFTTDEKPELTYDNLRSLINDHIAMSKAEIREDVSYESENQNELEYE